MGDETSVRLRNGEHGYGVVTKVLHWLTVAAIVGQFFVGYTMDADSPARMSRFRRYVDW